MKTFKKTLYIVITIIAIILLYFYMGIILLPKDSNDLGFDKLFAATSFKYEQKNTIDVIMYGNSDLYSGIVPMQIYENYGVPVFTCGVSKQTMHSVYNQLEKTLKNQKPKVVVIETDCIYYPNASLGGADKYRFVNLTSPFLYHSRWKEIELKDFVQFSYNTESLFMKGYCYSDDVSNYKHKQSHMSPSESVKPIEESVLKDFDKIYHLCKKNDIQLFLLELPSETSWSYAKHNGIEELKNLYNEKDENYQIEFMDLNLGFDEFIPSLHYRDNGNHCNIDGATIVTTKVGDYLVNKFSLEDKRAEEKYKKWNEDLIKFNNFINKQRNK